MLVDIVIIILEVIILLEIIIKKKTVVVITLIILRAVTSMDVTSSCITLFSQRKHLHTSLEIFAI